MLDRRQCIVYSERLWQVLGLGIYTKALFQPKVIYQTRKSLYIQEDMKFK